MSMKTGKSIDLKGLWVRDVIKSVTKVKTLEITVPSDVCVRCRIAIKRFAIVIFGDLVTVDGRMNMKSGTVSG